MNTAEKKEIRDRLDRLSEYAYFTTLGGGVTTPTREDQADIVALITTSVPALLTEVARLQNDLDHACLDLGQRTATIHSLQVLAKAARSDSSGDAGALRRALDRIISAAEYEPTYLDREVAS